jgi:hypothetical protein
MTYSGVKCFVFCVCLYGSMTALDASTFQMTLGSETNLGVDPRVCIPDTDSVTSGFSVLEMAETS